MIAVTCRNGEHFTLDPDGIARIEDGGDVSVYLEDGTHYVVGETFETVLRKVRDHRAARLSGCRRLVAPRGTPSWHVPDRPPRDRAGELAAAVPGPSVD